jgi:hypothetical protein
MLGGRLDGAPPPLTTAAASAPAPVESAGGFELK